MAKQPNQFHFPTEITLNTTPLVEAWLEIRWQLEDGNTPDMKVDPGFPFALGNFYAKVKDKYSFREELPIAAFPLEMAPYLVRYRFRQDKESWPLFQLGPGVATVNFTRPYSWEVFKATSLYLRDSLLAAYETNLRAQMVTLRYRNAIPCEYDTGNLLGFLKQNLNTSIELPTYIPGAAANINAPIAANISLAFDLTAPHGRANVIISTGNKQETEVVNGKRVQSPHLVFELEFISQDNDSPSLNDERNFDDWLTAAHAILHEWFFALVEGPLYQEFESGDNS